MSGLWVVVSGATSGIGRAIVRRFLAQGLRVLALARDVGALTILAAELGALGNGRLRTAVCDVRDRQRLEALAAEVGDVFAIVANAGICLQARLDHEAADAVWREVLATNLDGVYHTIQAFRPRMIDEGRIVAISSGLGKLGRAGYSAYSASKHAVLGLVKCVALELAPRRITVNAICPGWVTTAMSDADLERTADERGTSAEAERARAIGEIALGRFVGP
ncbi:MAG: SDR family oxidoreductase, partial [Myxococcales bacterium]|nr:SDR family oxidoreductase [Myxococcales bacterium]